MGDSAASLLKAVQTRLKAVLSSQVGTRVYGAVPANPEYPFVLVTCTSQPFATDDNAGMEHTLRVQAFAREAKPGTVLAIRSAVFDVLSRQEVILAVPGLSLIEHDGITDAFPEPDGRTYQSVIEFKVLVD